MIRKRRSLVLNHLAVPPSGAAGNRHYEMFNALDKFEALHTVALPPGAQTGQGTLALAIAGYRAPDRALSGLRGLQSQMALSRHSAAHSARLMGAGSPRHGLSSWSPAPAPRRGAWLSPAPRFRSRQPTGEWCMLPAWTYRWSSALAGRTSSVSVDGKTRMFPVGGVTA